MTDLAAMLLRSLREKPDSWRAEHGRNLALVNDALGLRVHEFGSELPEPARRFRITAPGVSLDVGPDDPAKAALLEAFGPWREQAQAAAADGLAAALAAQLAPAPKRRRRKAAS